MKAVLISIHPRHCANIAGGKKTVEVRKTVPRISTPFKCYTYQTKGLKDNEKYGFKTWARSGKVIGEFVCDRIDEYFNYGFALRDENSKVFDVGKFLSNACLTEQELADYVRGYGIFYGWHISDLKIYDKPKELSEFTTPFCPYEVAKCKVGVRLCKHFTFKDALGGDCDYGKRITRPPQSYMFVEEI